MLNFSVCNKCKYRNVCFLQQISTQKYTEPVQNFLINALNISFGYQEKKKVWSANYLAVQEQLVQYYDAHNCKLIENEKPFLTNERQQESDKEKIRELFKQMLDIAAKATEDKDPQMSIMFDGIGLVLASDYIEAVSKIFSMLKTAAKHDNHFSRECFGCRV